jgi:hypothetical protein
MTNLRMLTRNKKYKIKFFYKKGLNILIFIDINKNDKMIK